MRLIDVNLAKALLCRMCDGYNQEELCEPCCCDWLADLDGLTTVDAVEVVRCKDCKYYENDEIGWCNVCSHPLPEGDWLGFKESDFCSYGERREE